MTAHSPTADPSTTGADRPEVDEARERLLAGIPVGERRLEPAGISTSALVGGRGAPLVLLHGPGESAVKWMTVLPELLERHRVIAPDLPAHGASEAPDGDLGADRVRSWLDELIGATCEEPPTLVGHVLGGAIAARYAIGRSDRLRRLVLVDSLGLGRFRPSPRFALAMAGFLARPTEGSYARFMRQCSYDLPGLREQIGERWDAFVDHNLDLARGPGRKAGGRMMREVGIPRIPDEELDRIEAPTALIWGRQDRAIRLRVAEAASERHGWPLQVIDDCADDPPRDRPREFLAALDAAMTEG